MKSVIAFEVDRQTDYNSSRRVNRTRCSRVDGMEGSTANEQIDRVALAALVLRVRPSSVTVAAHRREGMWADIIDIRRNEDAPAELADDKCNLM